ncbi:hypothetical protein [Gimesia sp.]|uniref:hypothetical protein n=1 Tax=Gimesia sp. TaxID=2024833 RepID=UPI003A8E1401
MNRFTGFLLLISAQTLVGCSGSDGPQVAAVEGTVTWEGKPLADAGIAFTPEKGPVAIGRTNESGQFNLSTQGRNGAVVGSHRVTIEAFQPLPPGKKAVSSEGEVLIAPVSRIPSKYGVLIKSGLEAKVTANESENNFDFELK